MSQSKMEDKAPATKADMVAIITRLDGIGRRFESVDQRFKAIDTRFATLENQLDDRFDATDRRFDAVDQQFNKLLGHIAAEAKEIRLHAENVAEETRRHIDASNKNLRDYVTTIFDQKTYLYGETIREHDRRIRTLERAKQPAVAS